MVAFIVPASKFPVGRLLATLSALECLTPGDMTKALARHASGDWGELCDEDCAANEEALAFGLRLLSAYRSSTGVRFWIITEADRSATTILLPEDY